MANGYETRDMARDFKEWAERNSQYKYMGVVQGETWQDATTTATYFAFGGWAHSIAIPRTIANQFGQDARVKMFNVLTEIHNWPANRIHFLGSSKYADEVKLLVKECSGARGIDTSMPYVLGLHHTMLEEGIGYIDRPSAFFWADPDRQQRDLCASNARTFLDWARDASVYPGLSTEAS